MAFTRTPPPKRERAMPQPIPEQHRRADVVMATPALLSRHSPQVEPKPAAATPRIASAADEAAHMDRVASLGCVLCLHLGHGATPAEVHHLREGQGMAQRASNFLTVPLCPEHHRGQSGLHGLGERGFERRYRLSELDLLALTLALLTKAAA